MMYDEFMKKFFLADSRELVAFRLNSPTLAQKGLFLLSRHDLRRVHEKLFSRRFERASGC